MNAKDKKLYSNKHKIVSELTEIVDELEDHVKFYDHCFNDIEMRLYLDLIDQLRGVKEKGIE